MDTRNEKVDALSPFQQYTAWQLIKTYWGSTERLSAISFSIIIFVMTIGLVGFEVVFSYWYNYFYDALQAYSRHATVRLLVIFFILAGFNIILSVYRYYISQIFGLRWRRWLTKRFLERWLLNRSYYYLENFDEQTDNPDQRVQEDIAALVINSINLATGLIGSITTFFAFIYILWHLSGKLSIPLGRFGTFVVPGYLVWVSVIYALIGTLITLRVGRPLININFEQQRREATFRYAAIDLRTHAEYIALYRGEVQQGNVLQRLFQRVLDNYTLLILRQKLLLWFTSGYNQISVVLPLLVVLPNYFNKVFKLGGLMQSLQAFSRVQDSLSFIVNAYPQVAEWRAINLRLTTFINHAAIMDTKIKAQHAIVYQDQTYANIVLKKVNILTPKENLLLSDITLTFEFGKHYLLKGRSGTGKSTLIKAIAEIWPYATGEIILPAKKKVMFLSQKPYMPIGTLAEAILFPDVDQLTMLAQLSEILKLCNLKHLCARLQETAVWSEKLSPGEQQRVAFARVLLQKPDWLFMDESTSMLDLKNEDDLYALLKSQLPQCSLVSIGHRASLEEHHDEVINLEQYIKS